MKCRNCPISLRCLAGRLSFIGLCPLCGYLTVEENPRQHDKAPKAIRLRCERRPVDLTYAVADQLARGQGRVINDPVGGNPSKVLGVSVCAKCDAEERQARGWKAAEPSWYDAQEIDKEDDG